MNNQFVLRKGLDSSTLLTLLYPPLVPSRVAGRQGWTLGSVSIFCHVFPAFPQWLPDTYQSSPSFPLGLELDILLVYVRRARWFGFIFGARTTSVCASNININVYSSTANFRTQHKIINFIKNLEHNIIKSCITKYPLNNFLPNLNEHCHLDLFIMCL